MKIIKEDIEKSIYDYNKSIKKLEDAGIDYGDYTVTIHHTRWIKLLTLLKTHIEALDKIRAEVEGIKLDVDLDIGNEMIYNNAIKDVLEIIDKYRESEDKE